MKKFLLIIIIGACCISLHAAAPSGRSAPQSKITRAFATVEVLPGKPTVRVRITNLANVALEAWEVIVFDDVGGAPRPIVHFTADTGLNANVNRSEGTGPFLLGPIAPGATRDRLFPLSEIPATPSVEIRMLLFDDLSFEGSEEEVAHVFDARERFAESLQLWIDTLQMASGMAPQDAKTYLQKMVSADERRAEHSDGFAKAVRLSIAEISASPDAKLSERIAAVRAHLRWQRERAVRHHKVR